MADATQYQFDLMELAEMLLKKQGISSGLWTIGVNFGVGAANAGPAPEIVRPSMIISVDKLILTKADAAGPLTVDASKI